MRAHSTRPTCLFRWSCRFIKGVSGEGDALEKGVRPVWSSARRACAPPPPVTAGVPRDMPRLLGPPSPVVLRGLRRSHGSQRVAVLTIARAAGDLAAQHEHPMFGNGRGGGARRATGSRYMSLGTHWHVHGSRHMHMSRPPCHAPKRGILQEATARLSGRRGMRDGGGLNEQIKVRDSGGRAPSRGTGSALRSTGPQSSIRRFPPDRFCQRRPPLKPPYLQLRPRPTPHLCWAADH